MIAPAAALKKNGSRSVFFMAPGQYSFALVSFLKEQDFWLEIELRSLRYWQDGFIVKQEGAARIEFPAAPRSVLQDFSETVT